MLLEEVRMHHSEELFQLIDQNRSHLGEWLPWVEGVKSAEDTSTFLSDACERCEKGLGAQYAVFFRGDLAGLAGFHPIDWANRNAEVGYWLGMSFTGKGLATASVERLLRTGFLELGLNRMEIRCASGNLRSIAVAKRLGMVYEGTLREEEWLNGRYVDHVIYSILKKEYSIGTD
jgi:ribosomal-protein-serine acetyltransferase